MNENAANQRTTQTLADGSVWTYGYDNLGQLTAANRKLSDGTTVVPGQQFGYTCDTIGNRLTSSVTGETIRTTSYMPNVLNQYSQRDVSDPVDFAGMITGGNGHFEVAMKFRLTYLGF